MKRFVIILTAITLALTFCACSLVETEPEDVETTDDIIVSDDAEVEVSDIESVEEEEVEAEVIGIVDGEEIYDGESPFTINIVDPNNVSENAIYIETTKIPEEATEHVLDQLAHQTSGVLVTLGFTREEAKGASVASAFRAYNGSTGEYYDLFYFPIMYGDEAIAMSISSYNSDNDKYSFQLGKDQISDVMNYLETSPENPALFVYFDGSSGGYFITTTSAYRLVADENGSYKIPEEDIPDSVKAIMNRVVNPDNVVAIYGAEMEELIED